MPSSTSPIAASLPVTGLNIFVNTAASANAPSIIYNVQDFARAQKSTVVMVTNVGNRFAKRQPTLIDPGVPTFKVFYIPDDASMRNSPDTGAQAAGLIYLQLNLLLREFAAKYPADANGNVEEEAYFAFVTDFGITGKTAGVFEAAVTLGISDDNPSLP